MENNALKDKNFIENEQQNISESFVCCVCLDLLYKPIVLSCGHISCFWCVHKSMNCLHESHCPICSHPYYHFPTICQMLHFLLLKIYPVDYKRRENQILDSLDNGKGEKIGWWWSDPGLKIHIGAGCDFCGMYPIIGDRYRCIDCKEKIGFDLCGDCYNTCSKRPGRFNQQHTPEHKFQLVPVYGIGSGQLDGLESSENVEFISADFDLVDDGADNQNDSEANN